MRNQLMQTIRRTKEGRSIFIVASDKVFDSAKEVTGQGDVMQRLRDDEVRTKIKTMIDRTYKTIYAFLNATGIKKKEIFPAPNGSKDDLVKSTYNIFTKNFKNPEGCFARYMGSPLKKEEINSMLLNIYLTITGLLQNNVFIKPYTDDGNNFGEVKARWDKKNNRLISVGKDKESKIKQFCADYRNQEREGLDVSRIIHINLNRICDFPETLAVMTLIHEASHKFANTEDKGYFRNDKKNEIKDSLNDVSAGKTNTIPLYVLGKGKYSEGDRNTNQYKDNRYLEPGEAAENADTLAAIIYHIGNGGEYQRELKYTLKKLGISC